MSKPNTIKKIFTKIGVVIIFIVLFFWIAGVYFHLWKDIAFKVFPRLQIPVSVIPFLAICILSATYLLLSDENKRWLLVFIINYFSLFIIVFCIILFVPNKHIQNLIRDSVYPILSALLTIIVIKYALRHKNLTYKIYKYYSISSLFIFTLFGVINIEKSSVSDIK